MGIGWSVKQEVSFKNMEKFTVKLNIDEKIYII